MTKISVAFKMQQILSKFSQKYFIPNSLLFTSTLGILGFIKNWLRFVYPAVFAVLKKNLICKLFYAFTLSHQILSCGDGGIEACLWLMCCGTSCLQLRWGLQRVLTVFTPNILLQVELIRIDAALSTARRAPHHSLSPLSKSGDCSWMLTLQHGDGL